MSAAKIAAMLIHAHCRATWPDSGAEMGSTILNGAFLDVFDFKGSGSHKYVPDERLTADLGEPKGAGVYGYVRMYDDSYVLKTCKGPLAIWSGKDDEKAEWVA